MNNEKQKIIPELRFPEFKDDEKWVKTNLGSIGKPLMCKRIFKEQTTTSSENAIPFFKIGTFGGEADAFIPIELYNDYKSKYSFPNIGDILISASGTIGRLVVYDGADAYFQDSNIVWIGNDETQITNSLLFYCYSTLVWQTSDGGVIKRLYNSNLKEMEICFPSNPKEQQKIGNCLSSLDEVITAETEKLDLLQDHKKGLLQQLFPAEDETLPQYRFPEFENDGDWEGKELKKLLEFQTGYPFKSKGFNDENKGIRLIKNRDLKADDRIVFFEGSFDKSYLVNDGDILVGMDGDFSPMKWNKGEALLNQRVGRIRTENDTDDFFYYFLSIHLKIVEHNTPSTTVKHLSHSTVEKLEIPIPPSVKEQQKIANCLTSVDDLIEAQEQKIENLKAHKKGLMQQLFPKVNSLTI